MRKREDGFYWVLPVDGEWTILEWVNYPDEPDSSWFPRKIIVDDYFEHVKTPWLESDFEQIVGPLIPPQKA